MALSLIVRIFYTKLIHKRILHAHQIVVLIPRLAFFSRWPYAVSSFNRSQADYALFKNRRIIYGGIKKKKSQLQI